MVFKTREEVNAEFCALVEFYELDRELNDSRHNAADSFTSLPTPYHNNYHTKCVTVLCAAGAEYHTISYDDTRDLLIAALLHDVRHSGGRAPDSENIYQVMEWIDGACNSLSDNQKRKIKQIIRATEYPFKAVTVPYPIEIQILRDADIMQSVMPEWEMMYRGLQLEVSISKGKVISDIDWYTMTNMFYNEATLFTGWARNYIADARIMLVDRAYGPNLHMGWLNEDA